jgi:hypothetical protein
VGLGLRKPGKKLGLASRPSCLRLEATLALLLRATNDTPKLSEAIRGLPPLAGEPSISDDLMKGKCVHPLPSSPPTPLPWASRLPLTHRAHGCS